MEYPQLDKMSKQQMRQILLGIFQGSGNVNINTLETISLSAALQSFVAACRTRRLSPHTIEDYDRTIRFFIRHNGDVPMNDVTPNQIEAFLGSIQYSAKTVLNRWVGLAAFWTWAKKREYVEKHVVRLVDKPDPKHKVIEPFKEDEINAIVAAVAKTRSPRRNRAIVYILLDTGVRVTELIGIKREDVDFQSQEIKVLGKGNKERKVPFSDDTAQILRGYLKTIAGDPFPVKQRRSINSICDALKELTGIKRIYPHRFRHTFAINYLINGGDAFTLQKILGHTTMEMVKRYLAITESHVQQVHRRASPVMNFGLKPELKPTFHVRTPREQSKKARDMELRRKAKRLGYILTSDTHKLRTADHQGGYMLTNTLNGNVKAGESYELTLEQVDQLLGDE